jgi:hypothetical protein
MDIYYDKTFLLEKKLSVIDGLNNKNSTDFCFHGNS